MVIKLVIFFLIAMAVLGMFGRFKLPGAGKLSKLAQKKPRKCPKCGRYVLGKAPCDCGRRGR
jgi:hypothetical protein